MKKKGAIIFYSILVLIIVSLIIKNVYEANSLERNAVFVIGRIDEVKGAYQGRRVFYSYRYKGILFRNDYVTDQIHLKDKGRRFFFKVDSLHPGMTSIQYKVVVPDTLLESPYNGWDTLPLIWYQIK